eukprot:5941999-Prymnesium_polylepis.2
MPLTRCCSSPVPRRIAHRHPVSKWLRCWSSSLRRLELTPIPSEGAKTQSEFLSLATPGAMGLLPRHWLCHCHAVRPGGNNVEVSCCHVFSLLVTDFLILPPRRQTKVVVPQ